MTNLIFLYVSSPVQNYIFESSENSSSEEITLIVQRNHQILHHKWKLSYKLQSVNDSSVPSYIVRGYEIIVHFLSFEEMVCKSM